MTQTIGITTGDPKGIGPEIVAKALALLSSDRRKKYRVYGDLNLLPSQLSDLDAARAALLALNQAIADALAGKIAAIVTAPVNKSRLHALQPDFTGHTGYLARAVGNVETVMFFASQKLRVALVTDHLPISEVAKHLTKERIFSTIAMTHEALVRHFGIASPRLAILGLNPHAGESGALGKEEIEMIIPAIEKAKKNGVDCIGPFPTDGFFSRRKYEEHDAVIAMYHDQGLIPMKLISPHAVNMTLGLPFIRTSPGHGTAEDIVGKNKADPQGMLSAMEMAEKLIR